MARRGDRRTVLGWIILNIGHHLKFDYPDPWVSFPVVGTVDAHPKLTEVNAIFPSGKNSARRRRDAFRLCIVLTQIPKSLNPHAGDFQSESAGPARHVD